MLLASRYKQIGSSGAGSITRGAQLNFSFSEDKSTQYKNFLQSTGSEVDRHILSMMTESSVDFTNKFARLADAVVYSNESTSPAEDDE